MLQSKDNYIEYTNKDPAIARNISVGYEGREDIATRVVYVSKATLKGPAWLVRLAYWLRLQISIEVWTQRNETT